jgi:hypothetical protein
VASLALKEWAAVVRALLAGEQILDLRKGGLREEERHFDLRARRFWLYPTTEHQEPELLKPAYRRWADADTTSPPTLDHVRIEGWAEVAGVAMISEPDVLAGLESKFIWTREYAETRLKWKSRQPLWVVALRAHRLVDPVEVPMRAEYVGCASWVDLDGLPPDPASLPSEPALSDESFDARLKLCADALSQGFEDPASYADRS